MRRRPRSRRQFALLPSGCRNPSADRRVRRGSSSTQHLDGCERRQRVGRRHHGVLGMDRRPAGEMEIPHKKWLTLSLVKLISGV